MTFDPLGDLTADSAPDFDALVFGYRGGVADRTAGLVVGVDGLAYDPVIGRLLAPQYGRVLAAAVGGRVPENPIVVSSLYEAKTEASAWAFDDRPNVG